MKGSIAIATMGLVFLVSCTQFNIGSVDDGGLDFGSSDGAMSAGAADGVSTYDSSHGGAGGPTLPPSTRGNGNAGMDGAQMGPDASTAGSACNAGATRCASSGSAIEVCTATGDWIMKEACLSICMG